MRRPGFLSGNARSKPKHSSFGNFGKSKGYVAPAPAAPSGPTLLPISGGSTLKYAIDTSTGKFYIQDSRCPTGERMAKVSDPGDTETYNECIDDPNFKDLPEPPPGGFPSCGSWSSAGYPSGQCNQNTCPSCFSSSGPASSGGGGGGFSPRPSHGTVPGTEDDSRYASQQALFQPGPAAAGPAIPRIAIIGGAVLIGAIVLIKLIK